MYQDPMLYNRRSC